MTYNDPNHEKFEDERKVHVNQWNDGAAGPVLLAIVAVLLMGGGLIFFINSSDTGPSGPQVTQNNTALPAPIIEEPAAPQPATPPAAQPATPPVDAPATSP